LMSEILIGSNTDEVQTNEQKAKQLPKPVGYRILVQAIKASDTYDSGIAKAAQSQQFEELLSTVFFVHELGPDCYIDEKKFPKGAWCKKGDFILARPNTGTRLKIHGTEFRIINDDNVEGVVEDPRGISRV